MEAKKKILIIDDEAAVRRFLRMGLEPRGYDIIEACSGGEGLAILGQQAGQPADQLIDLGAPQFVVLDLGLPDQDGLAVLKRIREWSKVPVIILTVRDSDTEKVALLEAGADDYVTKPFSMIELIARLQVAERHSVHRESEALFRGERLEIDFSQHLVKLDGRSLKLTATEYNLLRVLAQGAGKVITQQKLRQEVWGAIGDEGVHYLRVYIGMLRKKMEADPAHPQLILTEPNVGYRLAEQVKD